MDIYPKIDDEKFQFSIAQRLEFRNLHNDDKLYPHQEFVRRFLSPITPYKYLIMFHSLGSGKSIACISVAVDHYLYDKKKCLVVTKGDSGTENFMKQVKIYHNMSVKKEDWDESIFLYKHYISLSNSITNMSDEDIKRSYSNKIIILDEVHNVRYLRKIVEHSVYGSIIKIIQLCSNIKIIMATATPMTDNKDQIKSLLGICNYNRDDIYSMNGIISYNEVIHDKPKSTQIGTEKYIPNLCIYTSDMIGYQKMHYKMEYSSKPPDDIYRNLTHISLFCFNDGICGREVIKTKMDKSIIVSTITSMTTKTIREFKYSHYTIKPEFSHLLIGDELRKCSSKYYSVMELLQKTEGNNFVFLEEVKGSGLLLLAAILEQHGYMLYNGEDLSKMEKGKRYTMCVGSLDICPNNNDRLNGFNNDLNKNGEYISVLLGSKVIGESITLKNVRNFHCLTPHWNDSTINQAIGRVIRNGSHNALDKDKRDVKIYIHASIYTDDPYNSVDILKLRKSKDKEYNISEVETIMKNSAIDRYCLLEKTNIPIKYVTNYAVAYLQNRINIIKSFMCGMLDEMDDKIYINDITVKWNIDSIICKEAICKFIFENEQFLLKDGKIYFIRAYDNYIFKVKDPSLPFIMMPEYNYESNSTNTIIQSMNTLSVLDKFDINIFRYWPVKRKIEYLEQAFIDNNKNVLLCLKTLYIKVRDTAYHTLLYKDVENSYTSTHPVPRQPLGKTRMFKDGYWITINSTEIENDVFDIYKRDVNTILNIMDKTYNIYSIISVLDGDMRVRLRVIENKNKSSRDNRYVRRGRNIKSIKKDILLQILTLLDKDNQNEYMSINEIIDKIDNLIIKSDLYIIF